MHLGAVYETRAAGDAIAGTSAPDCIGVAMATKLLAMKRPAMFPVIDSRVKSSIGKRACSSDALLNTP